MKQFSAAQIAERDGIAADLTNRADGLRKATEEANDAIRRAVESVRVSASIYNSKIREADNWRRNVLREARNWREVQSLAWKRSEEGRAHLAWCEELSDELDRDEADEGIEVEPFDEPCTDAAGEFAQMPVRPT